MRKRTTAAQRKQQQLDAMVQRLKDLAYPTIGDEWGGDCCVIAAGDIGKLISDVRYRFELEYREGSDLWSLFNRVTWLHEWQTPERIAELLIDHGVKP